MLGLHNLSVLAMKETQSPKEEGQGAAGLRGFTQGAEKFRQQTASKIAGHGGGENCQVILSGPRTWWILRIPGGKAPSVGPEARRLPRARGSGFGRRERELEQAAAGLRRRRNACTLGGLGDGSVDANGLREHLEPMLHGKVKAPFASQLLTYTARFMRGTTTFREMRGKLEAWQEAAGVSPETANDENAGRESIWSCRDVVPRQHAAHVG